METQQQQEEPLHQQQSLALTGRLLFIILDRLSQKDLEDSYLPTLDIISASGLNGLVKTEAEEVHETPVSLEDVSRTLGPEFVAWFELLGYDSNIKGIPTFRDLHHGMRAFMVTDDETVRGVAGAMDMDILQQPPEPESLTESAANAITDPDGTHDAGFLFLTTNIRPNIDRTQMALQTTDEPSIQHQQEVDVLENIDQLLGNVVLPALVNSSKKHGIAYTIVVMGEPYRATKSQNIDENTMPFVPFTITSLRSLCDVLKERQQMHSPTSQTNAPSSLASQENDTPAVRGSRDSIDRFCFSEKERGKCGLGTLNVSKVWEIVEKFFLEHLVCDSINELDGDVDVDVVSIMEQTKRNSVLALEDEDNAQDSDGMA